MLFSDYWKNTFFNSGDKYNKIPLIKERKHIGSSGGDKAFFNCAAGELWMPLIIRGR
jgi:hypothetical protein